MRAVQYREVGRDPEVTTIADPEPGPGQVLLRVSAAGVCHSDLEVMSWPADEFPFPLPLTLGHEGAGTVAALGDGVRGLDVGDSVAVYGPWGCGRCAKCCVGKENYCLRAAERGIFPPGLGAPGAIAEYLLVDDARHLVPLGELDPVATVPLTDAGLTPYHAIKRSLPKLVPGSSALVIGAGGLGHVAIQLLRALCPAHVIAADIAEDKLALARRMGAHETVSSDAQTAGTVRELTDDLGVQAVFDFVGIDATLATAAQSVAVEGDVTIVGIGGGTLPVAFGRVPYEATVTAPYWGTRGELLEVLDLARSGAVTVHVQRFGLDEAPSVYQRLRNGEITGRAVILPNG